MVMPRAHNSTDSGSTPDAPTILALLRSLQDPKDLNREELGGKNSALARGLPYYGRLRTAFPFHWVSFYNMHHRQKENSFPRDPEGFMQFIIALGKVPEEMTYPSVGRYDHSKGYVWDQERNRWNFRWQEYDENVQEGRVIGTRISQMREPCPICGKMIGLINLRRHSGTH